MSAISVRLLIGQGRDYPARRMILIYIGFMFSATTIWFVTGARTSAYRFVDAVYDSSPPFRECTAAGIMEKLAGVFQIWASDAALVRTFISKLRYSY
jgi:hypothetical protein